jgi:hypothetical protein
MRIFCFNGGSPELPGFKEYIKKIGLIDYWN